MAENKSIQVAGNEFLWDMDKGQLTFEGGDVVLFWISTAMKDFFDTLEEISGEEASKLVFETTGFRQGIEIGGYFEKFKTAGIAEAADMLMNLYATAGWGLVTVHNLCFEDKKVSLHLKDSWETKINLSQGKSQGTNFIAAHFAGVFSGLFGTNIWYKVVQDQVEGHEYSIVEYFPADVSVSENIHELARKKEAEQIGQLEGLVEEKTKELKQLIEQLSSPIIPVLEGIVVVPLIGSYDEERARQLIENTLYNLPAYKANYLVLDLTGLDENMGDHSVSMIEKMGSAAALIGIKTVLVGISAELGVTISNSGINLNKFDCFQTLQHGIHYALGQNGREII
ncbi:STAS domain-containing protein [Mesobacillus subterraneus]|uniref:STAS domain-containing protein n=1 Tax=Mesobacillus subterraneus TaxID=285983 RepID=A0A3R9FJP4_9BACI|nr:STAS domain-containing protein [Mesobacillus subterraneus]RSD29584.1 STAS domain-containing protein [Mesobacillus subterraneus]